MHGKENIKFTTLFNNSIMLTKEQGMDDLVEIPDLKAAVSYKN
jgi:hypothetical protein